MMTTILSCDLLVLAQEFAAAVAALAVSAYKLGMQLQI